MNRQLSVLVSPESVGAVPVFQCVRIATTQAAARAIVVGDIGLTEMRECAGGYFGGAGGCGIGAGYVRLRWGG